MAELTSDFPSEGEEEVAGKRQHKKNKKYFTESSDSQEESVKSKSISSKIVKKTICYGSRKSPNSSNSDDESEKNFTAQGNDNSELPIPQKLQEKSKQINKVSAPTRSIIHSLSSPAYIRNQTQHNKGNFVFFYYLIFLIASIDIMEYVIISLKIYNFLIFRIVYF